MIETKTPIVTIILPVYNCEEYVEKTIKSILDQTFKRFSLIIINDGSSDNTEYIITNYASSDDRIRVVNQKNKGVSNARNVAIELIQTKYFTYIDGDDTVSSRYLESLISISEKLKSDVTCGQIKMVKGNYEHTKNPRENFPILISSKNAIHELLYDGSIKNQVYAKIYRTSVFKHIRFDETLSVGEDMEYLFRVLMSSHKIAITQEVIYYYLQRPSSAMNSNFSLKKIDAYYAALKISETNGMSREQTLSTQTKLFTESFSALRKLYKFKNQYLRQYNECYHSSSKLAKTVMANKNTKKSQRLYATLFILWPKFAIHVANSKEYIQAGILG